MMPGAALMLPKHQKLFAAVSEMQGNPMEH